MSLFTSPCVVVCRTNVVRFAADFCLSCVGEGASDRTCRTGGAFAVGCSATGRGGDAGTGVVGVDCACTRTTGGGLMSSSCRGVESGGAATVATLAFGLAVSTLAKPDASSSTRDDVTSSSPFNARSVLPWILFPPFILFFSGGRSPSKALCLSAAMTVS